MRTTSFDTMALPFVLQADGDKDLGEWIRNNRGLLLEKLTIHGAILFQGFDITDCVRFADIVRSTSGSVVDYVYRSTPRTRVAPGIYTATEYPAHQKIPLHNENSYQDAWPMLLLFSCLEPASHGGQTLLAKTSDVTRRIGARIISRFAQKQIMYVRNYGSGADLPWQTVFQTAQRSRVEQFCRQHGIGHEWRGQEGLRTWHVRPALARHPGTAEMLWFNQVHLFHVSGLDVETRRALTSLFDERDLPRNAYYGDGMPIEEDVLSQIHEAYRLEEIAINWQAGDVLIIDNMLVAHGRREFIGSRRILVAMSDPCAAG